jgi:hypothetical protein
MHPTVFPVLVLASIQLYRAGSPLQSLGSKIASLCFW